ncbi:hypothetical protein DFH05DRAFT_1518049 [Lentinula detonsa]|uniref:DH domain-containing protein n=1 Tax=Lentinula detonsa TaxID=2804962 RepID=A0A9W8P9T0_9AGAR|nr:hypothetical protein DFH05DRAFT_1518049 [Lentinula detonsa]
MTATLSYSGSSVLSTPVLSSLSSSSTSSSNDSSSFYSVLYTDDLRSIDVGDSLTASTFGSSSNSPSGHTSPFILNPPTEAKAASAFLLASVKNIASSVNGTMFGTSFGEQRRLDRRKPTPLPLVDPFDEMLTLPQDESFIESMSSTNASVISRGRSRSVKAVRKFLRRRETSRVPGVRMERMRLERMNSLPSIPSTTLFPVPEPIPAVPSNNLEKVAQVEGQLEEVESQRFPTKLTFYPSDSARVRNTNAMASLAWTGTLSSALPSSFPISNVDILSSTHHMSWTLNSACRSTWSLSDSTYSDNALFSPTSLSSLDDLLPLLQSDSSTVSDVVRRRQRRRWTLAMVITDDQISDEKLVDKLERMLGGNKARQSNGWPENTGLRSPLSPVLSSAAIPSSNVCGSPREDFRVHSEVYLDDDDRNNNKRRKVAVDKLPSPSSNNHLSQSTTWKTARKTLLICREFVRTERHYLSYLRMMLSQQTMTPPLLLTYLPPLIVVSEKLLSQIEVNPCAVGVAEAFLSCGDQLESAFVGWCGVVGEIFAGSCGNMVPTIKRARTSGASFGRNFAQKDDLSDSRSIRRIRSWGRLISSIRSRSWSMSRRDDNALMTRNEVKVNSSGKKNISKIHIHSIRELAILPTQRVMRSLTFSEELVTYTPASPSQERVQMAHEGALLLAQKCDKAQENLAFLHGSR